MDGLRKQHVHTSRLLVWDTPTGFAITWTVSEDDDRMDQSYDYTTT